MFRTIRVDLCGTKHKMKTQSRTIWILGDSFVEINNHFDGVDGCDFSKTITKSYVRIFPCFELIDFIWFVCEWVCVYDYSFMFFFQFSTVIVMSKASDGCLISNSPIHAHEVERNEFECGVLWKHQFSFTPFAAFLCARQCHEKWSISNFFS